MQGAGHGLPGHGQRPDGAGAPASGQPPPPHAATPGASRARSLRAAALPGVAQHRARCARPTPAGAAPLLTADQLSHMASHFTHALCALKHNGVIDKAQQGFTALCERLLQQPAPALRALPQRCLHQLLAFARRPGQGRSDIVRRSGERRAAPLVLLLLSRIFGRIVCECLPSARRRLPGWLATCLAALPAAGTHSHALN